MGEGPGRAARPLSRTAAYASYRSAFLGAASWT